MRFFSLLLLFVALIFTGCDQKKQEGIKRYGFANQNNQYFEIRSNFSSLQLFFDKKPIKKNILLFFLDIENPLCLEYFQALKNLQEMYADLQILAISIKKLTREQMSSFVSQYQINFLLLNPLDSKNILLDFSKKINPDASPIALPFLILYHQNQKMYQYYQGAVPQEMFMFDLNNL